MIKKITLNNGLRILMDKIPYVRSVSVGIWVGTGSKNEDSNNNGVSHFIEHMLFKGTKKRTAKQISDEIDSIGGQINAFTSKECTCFYTKTLDTHANIAIDILSDMFFNSLLEPKDIELERKVILEEIGMYEDSPEDLVQDILSGLIWKDSSLGLPILGTLDSLKNIQQEVMKKYMEQYYIPQNTVIAVAGNFEEKVLVDNLKKYFGSWESKRKIQKNLGEFKFNTGYKIKRKNIEQVHLSIGFEGIIRDDPYSYPLMVLNNILGGSMSSRLFQRVREERGLVYSIYSAPSVYENTGIFNIYAGMNAENLKLVTEIIKEEIQNLKDNGISQEELNKSKEQLKGGYILGLESTSSRMSVLGKGEILLRKVYSQEEILQKIDVVEMEDIQYIINKIFNFDKVAISVVGNINQEVDIENILRE